MMEEFLPNFRNKNYLKRERESICEYEISGIFFKFVKVSLWFQWKIMSEANKTYFLGCRVRKDNSRQINACDAHQIPLFKRVNDESFAETLKRSMLGREEEFFVCEMWCNVCHREYFDASKLGNLPCTEMETTPNKRFIELTILEKFERLGNVHLISHEICKENLRRRRRRTRSHRKNGGEKNEMRWKKLRLVKKKLQFTQNEGEDWDETIDAEVELEPICTVAESLAWICSFCQALKSTCRRPMVQRPMEQRPFDGYFFSVLLMRKIKISEFHIQQKQFFVSARDNEFPLFRRLWTAALVNITKADTR